MPYPSQIGAPCWSREQVAKVVSITAQMNAASADRFLAAHSPFRQIKDAKSADRTVTEEEVFNDIFSKPREKTQAFVRGEPGTGKSHLIRWLYERFNYAARENRADLDKHRVVLVTRGNGSLKHALDQIVRQLGAEFAPHISSVQGAIDRLSRQTSRAMLLSELALQVDVHWTDRHKRTPLPRKLRNLGQALNSKGLGGWMNREGGVIDQVIKRLTDSSTVDEREHFPSFQASEFDVPSNAFTPQQVAPEVLEFVDDLREESDTREEVAATLNTALQDGIRGLTGLQGSDLFGIFEKIRRQLGSSRELVVFIEDVSASSGGLDQDIINAVEPRSGDGLCRLIAVLGIADFGWARLLKNVQDRATHLYDVGGNTVEHWAADPGGVSRFTARYLNAIRSNDDEIHAIASTRFEGDVRQSRCDDCPKKIECHAAFGSVEFGQGVTVGMFPFSPRAPQTMLQNLTDARYKSQRGLLDRIIFPALDQSFQSFSAQEFPRPQFFAVNPPQISFWNAGFLPRYCNSPGWSEDRKSRLRFLAQFWVNATTAETLAAALKPLLKPLGFPDFSDRVVEPPAPRVLPGRVTPPGGGPPHPPPPPPPPVDQELDRLLGLLDKWQGREQLKEDNKFRDLLGAFLSRCIGWEDHREIPISEKKRLISGNTFPRIVGQTMAPRGSYFFDFPRDAETLNLLQGLLMLSRAPSNTWDFSHGEVHKREVSRWLRKHRARVVQSIHPPKPAIASESLRSAVQALALVAFLRDRKPLPETPVERIASLFQPVWSESARPVILSTELQKIMEDLELRHGRLRDYVVQEVGVAQGDDGDPKKFINSCALLKMLEEFEKDFCFQPPPEEAESGFWSSRFSPVKDLRKGAFESIPARVKKEQIAISEAAKEVDSFVAAAGFEEGDSSQRLVKSLEALKSLIDLQRGTATEPGTLVFPDQPFDDLWQMNLIQASSIRDSWSAATSASGALKSTSSLAEVAAFNPGKLKECRDALRVFKKHLELIDSHLSDEEKPSGGQGGSRAKLLAVLEEIAKLSQTGEKGESDKE